MNRAHSGPESYEGTSIAGTFLGAVAEELRKESSMAVETSGAPSVTRKMAVLTITAKPDGEEVPKKYRLDTAVFSSESGVAVHMQAERFEEFGFPQEVTVAIYPGDRQDLMEREDFSA